MYPLTVSVKSHDSHAFWTSDVNMVEREIWVGKAKPDTNRKVMQFQRKRRFWIGIPTSILTSQLSVPLLLIGYLDWQIGDTEWYNFPNRAKIRP